MGVEWIFASPGSEWAPVWEHLAKSYGPGEIPKYLSTRHEEIALGMASGYYKTTGKAIKKAAIKRIFRGTKKGEITPVAISLEPAGRDATIGAAKKS